MMRLLLAGGGTLGSVSPLIALSHTLLDADLVFVGSKNGPERDFIRQFGIPFKHVASAKFRRYFDLRNIFDVAKIPIAVIQSFRIIHSFKPDIILTSGSFISVPVGLAGIILRIPVVVHQQDVEVGLANKLLRFGASLITVSFEFQRDLFPKSKTVVTGNPSLVGPTHGEDEQETILIVGGSSGARGLNSAVNAVITSLLGKYTIIHILGEKNADQVLPSHPRYTPILSVVTERSAYLHYVASARVIITRAGMSAITEFAALKKAVITIPMPETHQEINAEFLAQQGAARLHRESDEPIRLLNAVTELMDNATVRTKYEVNLQKLFPTSAAHKASWHIERIIHKRKTDKVHLVGIGGVGISALARYFKNLGYSVTGSDLASNEITRRLASSGIQLFIGHDSGNVSPQTSLLIHSTAVPLINVELLEARRRNIPVTSYKEYVGRLSGQYRTIAITGTHGKSTTTALTAMILGGTACDPTVILGTLVPQLGNSNFVRGDSDCLVIEADEYRSDMLYIQPAIAVITNAELDHTDYYQNTDHVLSEFSKFAKKLRPHSYLVINGDQRSLDRITHNRRITFGFDKNNDLRATNLSVSNNRQYFSASLKNTSLGEFTLQIPGKHNVLNALAALCVTKILELDTDTVQRRIADFRGTWRRFEHIGLCAGRPVISDYAHHPTEIAATIAAARQFYPESQVFLIFQPHSYARTESLLEQFVTVLNTADKLILTEIYDVAGRDKQKNLSAFSIYDKITKATRFWAPALDDIQKIVTENIASDDLVIIMGAGNIDEWARTTLTDDSNRR